jgi:hypothetical protein
MISVDIRHGDLFRKYSSRLDIHRKERITASVRAMNRATASARAAAARVMQADYAGLKISSIKARMPLHRATAGAPTAEIKFSGRRISLYGNFGMRAAGKFGIRFGRLPWAVETIAGEPVTSEMLQRAFRQRRGNRATALARIGAKRYPITILLAPGVARALERGNTKATTLAALTSSFDKVFEYEMERKLATVR